jgi:hypothetical protein
MRIVAIAVVALMPLSLFAERVEPQRAEAPYGIFRPVPARVYATSARTELPPMPSEARTADNVAGVIRHLTTAQAVSAAHAQTFRSPGATRIRLHLTHVTLPGDSAFAVFGAGGDASAFGSELLDDRGELWSPSVAGDTVTIEAPNGAAFAVDAIGHLTIAPRSDLCLLNASCSSFTDRVNLSASVGQMIFASGSNFYICSGGLINDKASSRAGFFLTANHCISTASEAASLEVSWDYGDSSCGANDRQFREKVTHGATLLTTSATSDVTLLRINSVPADRAYMGWNTAPPPTGTILRRISHPGADSGGVYEQVYSSTIVNSSASGCSSRPRPLFLYSTPAAGGVQGGSSGSPVIIDGGYIVGQLYGQCGPTPSDGCAFGNLTVDGAFSASYPVLQPYLAPAPAANCTPCSPTATTACLLGNRFKVTMTWRDAGANLSGSGTLIKYAENVAEVNPQYGAMSENAFFSMYSFAPKSVEAMVRIIRGVTINDKFWVFVTGFTGADYTVNVTDTNTCATWTRSIPAGATTVTKDFAAFPFP